MPSVHSIDADASCSTRIVGAAAVNARPRRRRDPVSFRWLMALSLLAHVGVAEVMAQIVVEAPQHGRELDGDELDSASFELSIRSQTARLARAESTDVANTDANDPAIDETESVLVIDPEQLVLLATQGDLTPSDASPPATDDIATALPPIDAASTAPTAPTPARTNAPPSRPDEIAAVDIAVDRGPVRSTDSVAVVAPSAPPVAPGSVETPAVTAVESTRARSASANSRGTATVEAETGVRGTDESTAVLTIARPDYGSNPPPEYPRRARKQGWQGTVLLRVAVSSTGAPSAVTVARSSGYPLLDDAAIEAVLRWRFRAARRGDEPVESTVEVPVTFRLQRDT